MQSAGAEFRLVCWLSLLQPSLFLAGCPTSPGPLTVSDQSFMSLASHACTDKPEVWWGDIQHEDAAEGFVSRGQGEGGGLRKLIHTIRDLVYLSCCECHDESASDAAASTTTMWRTSCSPSHTKMHFSSTGALLAT